MSSENMRILVTKRMLREGLLRCLTHTPLDKLSVSELCRESQVNRATFYNHYASPKDILMDMGFEYAREVQRLFGESNGLSLREKIAACFDYLYEHRQAVKILFAANTDKYLLEVSTDIFSWVLPQRASQRNDLNFKDDVEYRLAKTALGWAAYHLIRQWLTEDIPKTPLEIADLFLKLPYAWQNG